MYSYLVYDNTGAIKRYGNTNVEALIPLQAQEGETSLDITGNPLWNGSEAGLYVENGQLAKRPAMPVTCPSTASAGSPVTLTAPGGATVSIDGVGQGTMDPSGSEQITFSDPGTYALTLSLWPYLDASLEVVVS